MLIILNEDDCVGPNGIITVKLDECARTVKSDGQVIYETGNMGHRTINSEFYIDQEGILVRRD